ncbi:MAG: trigger factor [SAR202 cluster bacterium Io17-Chloro-G9]|nr:MAG: trigger factor [SAR202 cluster bacterium Io17-Chloro-G9]
MNVTKESETPTEVTLNISMDSADEEPFIGRSYRRLVTRLAIPGFRPGKAPRSIVERHVGRTTLVQEALEFMIPETLDQVLKDEDLSAFAEPQLEILEVEPVSFKAVVPLEPIVDLGNFREVRLEKDAVEVTEEQVGEVLEQLRFESAPWEPVERNSIFGDLMNLNVTGTILGEQVINDQGIDFVPELENPNPIPGFSVHLEGMTEGQKKEFALTIPEDSPQAEYAGKECNLSVEVLSIKEKNLPELDDDFAKGVRDGYESLEALREDVERRLLADGDSAATRQLEQAGMEELLKNSTIQASDLVYQRELDMMREDRERAIRNQRLDMDTYLSYLGQTQDEWQEQLRPQAEERLKSYLVLRKLAEEESLEVSDGEIDTEIDTLASTSTGSEEQIRQVFSTDSSRESMRSSLLNRKVMGRLVEILLGEDGANDAQIPGEPEAAEESDNAPEEPASPEPGPDQPEADQPEAEQQGAEPNAS